MSTSSAKPVPVARPMSTAAQRPLTNATTTSSVENAALPVTATHSVRTHTVYFLLAVRLMPGFRNEG